MPSRPLTTRSIVLSLLLGSHPPEASARALVQFGGLFGVSSGAVRTALSRMADRGDLIAVAGRYRLGPHLVERQLEQDSGRARRMNLWNGTWFTAIVTADRRPIAERRAFRARAVGAKLGEMRPDLWMRPANISIPTDLRGAVVTNGKLVSGDHADLVRRLWDLPHIDHVGAGLTSRLAHAALSLEREGSAAIPQTFESLALALRHLRTEPQLPRELHASDVGDRLRARYDEVEQRFRTSLTNFLHP